VIVAGGGSEIDYKALSEEIKREDPLKLG